MAERNEHLGDESAASREPSFDVLIVGSGIMGAATAATIRERYPAGRVLMIDAGTTIGDVPGLHLHETADPVLWDRYNQKVSSGIQGYYAPELPEVDPHAPPSLRDIEPGVHRLTAIGEEAEAMPGAAASWNTGGMGVHWTAATPRPWGDELPPIRGDWDDELAAAERLLHVTPGPVGLTAPGEGVLAILKAQLAGATPGREPQLMPMAVQRDGERRVRIGPSAIFPPMAVGGDERFELRQNCLAVAIESADGRVSGVRVRDLVTGEESVINARFVIVCADPHRTPQLLYASGIRPAVLGRNLNAHAFLSGRVIVDVDRLGLELSSLPRVAAGEFATDSLWVPHDNARQPFHGQIMSTVFVDDSDRALAYSVGISLYVPVESSAQNRIVFSDRETDVFGMPRMRLEHAYSDADDEMIRRGREFMKELARSLGSFDPDAESALLPAGASLHQTGTVRFGSVDDGESVCDDEGRVWGMRNLFVAGTGVIPTAVACNTTLMGVVFAARAARRVAAELHQEARV